MSSTVNDQNGDPAASAGSYQEAHDRRGSNGSRDGKSPATMNVARNSNYLKSARDVTGYLEISDYAVIGNLRTAAMVSRDASIDSFCFPYFDSPSVFCRLLDKDIGGHFSIQPITEQSHSKQQYSPNSAVITTKFLSDEGVCTVTDFMPRPSPSAKGDKPLLPWLVRRVEVIRGKLPFRLECFPGFNYARQGHQTDIVDDTNASKLEDGSYRKKAVFKSDLISMELRALSGCNEDSGACHGQPDASITFKTDTTSYPRHKGLGIVSEFILSEGQTADFVFREVPETGEKVQAVPNKTDSIVGKGPVLERKEEDNSRIQSKMLPQGSLDPFLDGQLVQTLQDATNKFWYTWVLQSKYTGRWREFVHRSAITLKLLTFELTGAIVAAPTFALPEGLNGEGRNWDYRYSWIRDASFTVYAFIRLGYSLEAISYMEFVQSRLKNGSKEKPLQIVFGIRGESELEEIELSHLSGYKGQKPVRIGNGAASHLQLDVYGELMDAVYLSSKLAKPCSWELWKSVRDIVDYVTDNYDQKDMSIWEVRNMKQNFVYSKIMMWVALDRGLRLADKRSLPCPNRAKWLETRDKLYEEVMEKGWNEEKGFFCQSYENKEALDASVCIMPLVFFISPVDPRFLSTLKEVLKAPERGGLTLNNLVYRYDVSKSQDGVGGEEGAFLLCACWTIEALTRAGQHDAKLLVKAREMFEDLIGYSNHVGLFSEEISKSGEALGNMPQAFTHIAMISAAFNLNRVLGHTPIGE